MMSQYRKFLNFEVPKDLEPIIQKELEKTLLRAINGLEIAIKKDIQPPLNKNKKLLYQEKYLTLYHYLPSQENVYDVPVILVPPLMTTTDIFDLVPEHSLVNELVNNGFNVYLVDFGKPDRDDSHLKIDDYILNFLYRAVHMTKKHADAKQVSLLGFCLGGTFSIIYGSVSLDIKNDVKNVINIAGPVDLKCLPFFNLLFKPFKKEWFNLVDKFGCIPKELLTFIFQLSDPIGYLRRPIHVIDKAWDRDFLVKHQALNNFFNNFQNLPGTAFKQSFEIIVSNELVSGKLKLLDQKVNLANFQSNLLAFSGSKDTFIPPDSVREVHKHISTKDFQYSELPFGHISIMGSDKARDTTWKTCVDWLKIRSGEFINSKSSTAEVVN
ncbi:MAG: alpha/beta fold hydrolase [Candidatus Melainabacteria bacterium]|nr:alpha/beta fold hydrolase [Candidatus Melainabacteria bacterium]